MRSTVSGGVEGGQDFPFPLVGQEAVDFFVGMGGDAQEEVAQVEEGIELVTFDALDDAVEDGGTASAAVGTGE